MNSLLDIHPTDLAEQLTLLDFGFQQDIKFSELLNGNHAKDDGAPSLSAIHKHFNSITRWIGSEIVTTPRLKDRIKVLSHCILVGIKLLSLRNYAGIIALSIALSQFSISRLDQTWKGLSDSLTEKWEKILSITSPQGNFKSLRNLHDNSLPPTVKAVFLFQKDILFIEEGNKNFSSTKPELWNVTKIKQLGKVIAQIHTCQNTHYPFEPNPQILHYIAVAIRLDEKTQEKFSRMNEPTVSK